MSVASWLNPHLDLKKWSFVFVVGVALTVVGAISLSEGWMPGLIVTLVGVGVFTFAALMAVRMVIKTLRPVYGHHVVETLHRRYSWGADLR